MKNNADSFRQLTPEQRTAILSSLRDIAADLVTQEMMRCITVGRDTGWWYQATHDPPGNINARNLLN